MQVADRRRHRQIADAVPSGHWRSKWDSNPKESIPQRTLDHRILVSRCTPSFDGPICRGIAVMFGPNTTALYGQSPHQARFELIPLIVGLALLGYATFYTTHFAIDEFDYRVIGSRLVCAQPLNNRCVTHYSIQNSGAQAPGDYRFYGYQFAEGDLLAGNDVRKVGIGFAYSVNGRVKTWSHGSEMSLWAAGALVLFIISYCWHRILRRSAQLKERAL